MFFPLDSRANSNSGYYYDLKHVGIGYELGFLEFMFQFQNNLKGAIATALNKNQATDSVPPVCSLRSVWYHVQYATFAGILRKAFADDTILGDERANQLVIITLVQLKISPR